ncbi:glycoside hydrolase family 97 protein [Rhodocytophaga aerolata]|uniref:Glycoside hydrolase family 97 protein n=1 Tax=Rhodocytophaga aerolata TaxID=455078 RepID=A0ABT8R3Q7_9BACT|nr:glycoside hydrolase family 97 protein [Rhodocytophaga aerolata]MDO1446569.1 glycoside hydrolase family 97 protein [Rhodocytophaga aerolata]
MLKYVLTLLYLFTFVWAAAREIKLQSPDGKIEVRIQNEQNLTYSIYIQKTLLLDRSVIDLELDNGTRLSADLSIASVKRNQIRTTITSPVPEKRRIIPDHYTQVEIRFRQPYSLIFRVYDDGVAYRMVTHFPDSIVIKNELALFNFAKAGKAWCPLVKPRQDADQFHTAFEEDYTIKPLDSLATSHLMFTPVLIQAPPKINVLITEADLVDFPGMFLTGTSANSLRSSFAPYPLEEKMVGGEFPQKIVTKRAGYIARTIGTRSLPWRVIALSTDDKSLPSNDMVYRLASPSKVQDLSWIKPGKSTEEWIIGSNLYNVPFKAGINTATYKYYIDFAKRFGFERILLDAGWSDNTDLFQINPEINMEEIASYAKKNSIGLSLWTLASTLDRQLEPALEQFTKWGVDFIMTDFMDRDDQKTVNFHHRIAEACARHKIMLMFHGSFKPAGFNRTWPHALTREGVLGSEYNKWSRRATPTHNVTLPFIRMVSGPMDYEPGLLQNATEASFRPIDQYVMSLGTRCHQMAMFVVYDSPMQFFSGNPSTGMQEPELMELLGSIPTVWDETSILDGKVGEFIITNRKKDNTFYLGAMTNWETRTFSISLDFLGEGEYQLTAAEDGMNADRYAADYKLTTRTVRKGDTLEINLVPGGGFLGKFLKVSN